MAVHDHYAELAAAYALGSLTSAETLVFEAHLAVCSACAAEVRGFVPVLEALGFSTAEAAPEPAVRQTLLTRLRE